MQSLVEALGNLSNATIINFEEILDMVGCVNTLRGFKRGSTTCKSRPKCKCVVALVFRVRQVRVTMVT
jgi:hypothetical protein